ncbi:MAG: hypothetical protein ACJAZO_004975 [Myxococcota bacterium]
MKQSAAVRPEATFHRKAAVAYGAALDHTGKVHIKGIPDFDLDRTIFQTLEGTLARYVMRKRVAKEVFWADSAASTVQKAYDAIRTENDLPSVDPDLVQFLVDECDFDVEHADGSFLDHLYFGFEYTAQHYPQHSPLVMLLHSILGTGTNTFAMEAAKIPALEKLMTPFEWRQTEAFPTVLRLLYAGDLRRELQENAGRASTLQSVCMHRVIDNAPIEMSGEDFWIAMNYQLIHLIDFLPVANWSAHQSDTSFILFRHLYALMQSAGELVAHIDYTPASGSVALQGEAGGFGGWLTTKIPVSLAERMASKSVRTFSERIGHSLDYTLVWG